VTVDQLLVGDDRLQVGLGNLVGQHDILFDGIQLVGVGLDFLHQSGVNKEDLVGCVVDSELEVPVGQAHVTHVEAATRTARRKVELEVSVVVHRDRANPAVLADAEFVQRVTKLGDPVGCVGVRVAVFRAVRLEGDDLPLRKQLLGAADDPVHRELHVHHRHCYRCPGTTYKLTTSTRA
jgi:hypothetical protein